MKRKIVISTLLNQVQVGIVEGRRLQSITWSVTAMNASAAMCTKAWWKMFCPVWVPPSLT